MLSCGWGFNLKGKVLLRAQGCIVLYLASLPSSWVGWAGRRVPLYLLSGPHSVNECKFGICESMCTLMYGLCKPSLP